MPIEWSSSITTQDGSYIWHLSSPSLPHPHWMSNTVPKWSRRDRSPDWLGTFFSFYFLQIYLNVFKVLSGPTRIRVLSAALLPRCPGVCLFLSFWFYGFLFLIVAFDCIQEIVRCGLLHLHTKRPASAMVSPYQCPAPVLPAVPQGTNPFVFYSKITVRLKACRICELLIRFATVSNAFRGGLFSPI